MPGWEPKVGLETSRSQPDRGEKGLGEKDGLSKPQWLTEQSPSSSARLSGGRQVLVWP